MEVTARVVLITVQKDLKKLSLVDIRGAHFLLTKSCRVHMGVFVLPVQAVRRVSGIRPAGKSL